MFLANKVIQSIPVQMELGGQQRKDSQPAGIAGACWCLAAFFSQS